MKIIEAHIESAGYALHANVLKGVDFSLNRGEIVGVVGANGAGKSTFLKALIGMISVKGSVHFKGKDILRQPYVDSIRQGISYLPQGNKVFDELSVEENLEIAGYVHRKNRSKRGQIDEILKRFPMLEERKDKYAGLLSGGERALVSLARAFVVQPEVLLIDEPSAGVAPNMLDQVFDVIRNLHDDNNTTVVVVEQNVERVLDLTSRIVAFRLGSVAFDGEASNFATDENLQRAVFLS